MATPHFQTLRHTILVLAAAIAAACSATPNAVPTSSPSPTAGPTGSLTPSPRALGPFEEIACSLPRKHLLRIWNGYDPQRSGQLQILPREPHFIGKWLSHSGPWDYVQRVPFFLYGPGRIAEGVTVDRPTTMADIAPTLGRILGFDFEAPDGAAIDEALVAGASPPKLVLLVVWDAAGRNVLAEHPRSWPVLKELTRRGAWMERMSVGSSPSVTPTVHTTLGTGAYPRTHGVVDLRFKVGDELLPSREVGPQQVLVPSMADLFDEANANQPKVGLIASGGTLGMMGVGTLRGGGDKDIVVAEFRGEYRPQINTDLYDFPPYVDDMPGPETYTREVDLEDGRLDGVWMGESVLDDPEDIGHTPAYSRYQRDVIQAVIEREGFGADETPDILFTNFKQVDNVSHRWSMNSPQMEAVVRSSDAALGDLVDFLDATVGEGEWALALTSDHGSTPSPEVSGAFVIDNTRMLEDLRAAFDGDGDEREAIQDFRVTQVWLDVDELAENGHTIKDVARFVADYTAAENAPDGAALTDPQERLFEAAFPGAVLEDLPCLAN